MDNPSIFCDFSIISYVFINVHGYIKLIIYMLNQWVKVLYLDINSAPCLVTLGNW